MMSKYKSHLSPLTKNKHILLLNFQFLRLRLDSSSLKKRLNIRYKNSISNTLIQMTVEFYLFTFPLAMKTDKDKNQIYVRLRGVGKK